MSLAGMKLNSTLINELRMQKMDEDIQAGATGPTRQGEPQSVRKQEGLAQRRDGGKEPRGTRRGLARGASAAKLRPLGGRSGPEATGFPFQCHPRTPAVQKRRPGLAPVDWG